MEFRNPHLEAARAARLRMIGAVLAGGAFLHASWVLFGWLFGFESLRSYHADWTTMKAMAAVAIMLVAAGVLLQCFGRGRWSRRSGVGSVTIAAVIGGVALFEVVLRADLGLDRWLVRGPETPETFGSMSGWTAVIVLLLAGAVCAAASRRFARVVPVLAWSALAASLLAATGYLYDPKALYTIPGFTSVPAPAAACCIALSMVQILLLPGGLVGLVVDEGPAGVLVRRTLPWVLAVLIVTDVVALVGASTRLLDPALAGPLAVVPSLVIGPLVLLRGAMAVRESHGALQTVLETAVDGILSIDERGRILSANLAAQRMFGYLKGELLGRNISMLMPSPYREQHDGYIHRYLHTGERKIIGIGREVSGLRKDGVEFPIDLAVSEVEVKGRRVFWGFVRDLSEHRRQEATLRESQERFEQFADHTGDGLWFAQLDPARVLYANHSLSQVFGVAVEQILSDPELIPRAVHPDDLGYAERSLVAFLAGRARSMDDILRIVRRDGAVRWIRVRGARLSDGADGRPRIAGMIEDITERHEAQRRQNLLLDELDHRVKNNLATVLAVAQQTLRGSAGLDEFQSAFIGRIDALARTHGLLASQKWKGVDVRQMIEETLGAYTDSGQVEMSGPTLMLPGRATQPLCLVLHELATNAAKYGCFRKPGGRLDVRWRVRDPEASSRFCLSWVEAADGAVAPPTDWGFGLKFVKGVVAHELRGFVEIRFEPGGLQVELDIPLFVERARIDGAVQEAAPERTSVP